MTIPDAALADIDIAAEQLRAAADLNRRAGKKPAARAKRKNCTTCRTPDWKSADGRRCYKLRIELDPKKPKSNCQYWRKPLAV